MYTTAYLVALLLLALSIVTIEFCRRDRDPAPADTETYLFRGKRALHAIASNLGSSFSATYLLGGAIVFTHLIGWWAGLIAMSLCLFAYLLYRRLLRQFSTVLGADHCREQRGNLLLDLLGRRLEPRELRSVAALYAAIYFGLLIEELAVSRALLNGLVPRQPVLAGALLLLLCVIVAAYIYVGGFRAVLTSDIVQGAVLAAFVAMLIVSSVRASNLGTTKVAFEPPSAITTSSYLLVAFVFGLSWFVAALDVAARLNFQTAPESKLLRQHDEVMRASFAGTALLLLAAVVFGELTRSDLAAKDSPGQYIDGLMRYFVHDGPRIVQVTFLVSLLCMMFTTIDTLIMTTLQASHYTRRRWARRESVIGLLVASMFLATAVPVDRLYLFGLLAGGLLVLPMLLLLPLLVPKASSFIPRSGRFAWLAFVATWGVYVTCGDFLAATTATQFLSPGIPLLFGLGFLLIQQLSIRRGA